MEAMRSRTALALGLALSVGAACANPDAPDSSGGPPSDTVRVPLTELGTNTYLGFPGGLYAGSGAVPPTRHDSVGRARARMVQPLDAAGNPDPSGKIVLLSVGMSNTTQEFCSQSGRLPCDAWTFMGQAAADPAVNSATLVLANGARGGQAAATWDASTDVNYDRVRDSVLAPLGLTERQVQVVWVKQANPGPTVSLPSPMADAYRLEVSLAAIVRVIRIRYPKVQQVFLSSRIYGGYATTTLNPEPYAYESGFAVKWLVEAQSRQMQPGGPADSLAGDLNYDTTAPWLAWGPYVWADGMNPRDTDGLTWSPGDFAGDGTHPSQSGEQKVGGLLLWFFKTSPYTTCWFVNGGSCP